MILTTDTRWDQNWILRESIKSSSWDIMISCDQLSDHVEIDNVLYNHRYNKWSCDLWHNHKKPLQPTQKISPLPGYPPTQTTATE